MLVKSDLIWSDAPQSCFRPVRTAGGESREMGGREDLDRIECTGGRARARARGRQRQGKSGPAQAQRGTVHSCLQSSSQQKSSNISRMTCFSARAVTLNDRPAVCALERPQPLAAAAAGESPSGKKAPSRSQGSTTTAEVHVRLARCSAKGLYACFKRLQGKGARLGSRAAGYESLSEMTSLSIPGTVSIFFSGFCEEVM